MPTITKTSTSMAKTSTSMEKTSTSMEETSTSMEQTSTSMEQTSTSMEKTSTSMVQSSTSMEKTSTSMEETSSATSGHLDLDGEDLDLDGRDLDLDVGEHDFDLVNRSRDLIVSPRDASLASLVFSHSPGFREEIAIMPNPVALDSLVVDCSSLASFLVDLPPRARLVFINTQPGYADAVAEVKANQDKHGEAAGITKADIDSLTESDQRIAEIDSRLPALYKLVEILEETRAKEDDKRQRQLNAFAEGIDRRAKMNGDTTLLAKYEKTRACRSAVAVKAAKTKAKKAERKAEPTP